MLYLHQIFNGIWMMNADHAANYLPIVSAYIKGDTLSHQPIIQQSAHSESNLYNQDNGILLATVKDGFYHVADYNSYRSPENAPENSIAVITITGAMTKYDQYCGPAGMETKSNLLQRCYANANIEGIVLKVDSGGGESLSWRLMKETIGQRNKPIIGFAYDCACSAAYGLLSCCDMIVANSELAEIGSIGSYGTILDYRDKLEKEGIKLIEIYATASKDKNLEFREALNGNLEPLRAKIDVLTEDFIKHIENSRVDQLTSDRKVWGTGKTFYAKEALGLGLIDKIDSFNNILNYFN